jgi:hypothetical protein
MERKVHYGLQEWNVVTFWKFRAREILLNISYII